MYAFSSKHISNNSVDDAMRVSILSIILPILASYIQSDEVGETCDYSPGDECTGLIFGIGNVLTPSDIKPVRRVGRTDTALQLYSRR